MARKPRDSRGAVLVHGGPHPALDAVVAALVATGWTVLRAPAAKQPVIALLDGSGLAEAAPVDIAAACARAAAADWQDARGRAGCLLLLARPDDARPVSGRLREAALHLAPRLRINAVLAGDRLADSAAAARLLIETPAMTGQVIALAGRPAHMGMPEELPQAVRRGEERYWAVLIRDLVLPTLIGVHRHERAAPQRVRINVELMVAPDRPLRDRLADVVCYDTLADRIRRLVAGEHVNLAETLAERIAELALSDPRVVRAAVTVEKLDVYEDAASVGVRVEREQGR